MRHLGGASDYSPGRTVSGVDAVAQRCAHILDTATGGLPQDPEWGWSLRDALGVGLDDGDLTTLAAIGREAFRRDPEVLDATVTITAQGGNAFLVQVRLETSYGATTLERQIT